MAKTPEAKFFRPWVLFHDTRGWKPFIRATDPMRATYRWEELRQWLAKKNPLKNLGKKSLLGPLLCAEDHMDMGKHSEAREILRDCLKAYPGHREQAWCNRLLGVSLIRQDRLDKAEKTLSRALKLALKEKGEEAQFLELTIEVELAYILIWKGQWDQAKITLERLYRRVNPHYREGGEYARAWGALAARILNDRGVSSYYGGNMQDARRLYIRCATLRRKLGLNFELAITLNNLCEFFMEASDYRTALKYAHRTQAIFSETSQQSLVLAFCHDNLGDIFLRQGDVNQAQVHYRRAIEIAERGHYKRIQWEASLGLAEALEKSGDFILAESHVRHILKKENRVDIRSQATAHRALASILLAQGKFREAKYAAETGEQFSRERGLHHESLPLKRVLAGSLRGIGELDKASTLYREALEQARMNQNALEEGRLSLGFALCHQAITDRGKPEHRELARYYFTRARDIFEKIGAQAELQRCYRSRFSRQYLMPSHLMERLPPELVHQVENLMVLLEMTQELTKQPTEQELLARVLNLVMVRSGAQIGLGVLLDEQEHPGPVLVRPEKKVRRAGSVVRRVWFRDLIRQGNPLLLSRKEVPKGMVKWVQEHRLQQLLVLPLRSGHAGRGGLLLGHKNKDGFDKDLLGLWMGFATQAALALEAATLYRRATRDPLTGLHSRHFAEVTLERELGRASRSGARTSVLFLDLDHFKSINDTYGHQVGDEALVRLAKALPAVLRHSDLVGRWGGEEFVVILPDTGLDAALGVAEKLRKHVQDKFKSFRPGHPITVSIGVDTADPHDHRTFTEILGRADKALYRAKRGGRNRVEGPTD